MMQGGSMSKISVGFSGDILLHGAVLKKAHNDGIYKFGNMLGVGREVFKADVNLVNQESLAAGEAFGISSYPSFNSPIEILSDLKELGVSWVNVANNHMLDKGEEGLIAYLKNLDKAGLNYVGASLQEQSIKYVEVDGIKVSFVSYTDGSKINLNKIDKVKVNYFKGESYAMRMNRRLLSIKNDIKEAKKNSDFVVLILHFGEEYFRSPSSFQKDIVNSLVEADIDALIGHHPHVLQPIEWVENSKGREVLVAYSLGNFFSGQLGLYRQLGCYLTLDFFKEKNKSGIERIQITPTFVDVYNEYKLTKLRDLAAKDKLLKTGRRDVFSSSSIYSKLESHLVTDSLKDHSAEICYE